MIDRRAVLALAAGPFALAAEPAAQPFEQAAFDAALAQGRPMLVEISASWRPVCRVQKDILAAPFAQECFADMLLLEVDFDSRKDVVRALGARARSTLIV